MDYPKIDTVDVAAYRVPTDMSEGDGTLNWEATELVVVHIASEGKWGMGYSYTAGKPAAELIEAKLAPLLQSRSAFDLTAIWDDLNDALRNAGRPGMGMMAISAVDHALWDLKAKLLALPLVALWGRARPNVSVYGSGGFVTYSDDQLREQLGRWVDQGIDAVKIKVGDDIAAAEHRVAVAREIVGQDVELMVDVNGACHAHDALVLAQRLQHYGVSWLEEPVSSDDLEGLRWLRDRTPPEMAIAAGEYGWDSIYYRRMLEAGAVDVLQVDATRCGYTGFMETAQLCAAFGVPLSAHCAPALHASIGTVVPAFVHLEYFHDHVRLETMLFDGGALLRDGQLWPDQNRAGHGIELRAEQAERYRL